MFQITEFRELTTVERLAHKAELYKSAGDLLQLADVVFDINKILRDNYPCYADCSNFDDCLALIEKIKKKEINGK